GFGLPPLEAAACGTPSIVSDLPVLRETAPEGTVFRRPGDVDGWAEAISDVLTAPRSASRPPARTWSNAAAELAALLT
ncbi:MAG: group 1 glycosyl transferase, partial [Frankiales bacterium]|nr:group 1 glycosyl transferase [Frankiales bacterium]